MPFGKRLKDARLKKGMTQEELASAVGVSKGAIGNYESEVSSPKEPILIKLMKVLGIDANYLYQDFINLKENLSDEERRLLAAYRFADQISRDNALMILESSAAKREESKKDTTEQVI